MVHIRVPIAYHSGKVVPYRSVGTEFKPHSSLNSETFV